MKVWSKSGALESEFGLKVGAWVDGLAWKCGRLGWRES